MLQQETNKHFRSTLTNVPVLGTIFFAVDDLLTFKQSICKLLKKY